MVNAGRILIMPKGEWDTLVSYNMLDLVTYSGVAYLAKQASTGVNPKTDPNKDAYWQVFGTSVVPDNATIIFDGNNNLAVNIDGTTIQYDSGTNFVKVAIDGVSLKYDSTNGYIYADVVSSLAGLSDVNLTNIRNGQIIAYNSASQKFVNIDLPVGGGSKIKVTTTESTLYGKTVTLSDGTHTMTGTFSNSGEYTFEGVEYTGNLVITSSDGTDTATRYLTVPYYSSYSVGLTFFEATVTVTYPEDLGATCNISDGVTTIAATGSPMAFIVPNAGTWTATVTLDGADKTGSVTIGASGESKSITITFGTINVTYSDDFKGVSITCVNGGTTITKTAPTTGNTMSFYPPTTGQWTISGTVGGVPYPTTANVTSLSTPVPVNLETIPDGSTATPTDDITKWLECAGITDKAYTTLSQVLGDSETYNALLGDSNACAYMKRSTTWSTDICADQYAMNLLGQYDTACDALLSDSTWASAIANSTYFESVLTTKVPTMTGFTTPEGEVFPNNGSSYSAYHAFDGTGRVEVNYGSYGRYIGYKFTEPIKINVAIVNDAQFQSGYKILTYKIVGSNNGTDWTDLSDVLSYSGSVRTIILNNTSEYLYYALYGVTYDDTTIYQISTIQFYGRASSGEKIHGGNPTYDSFYRIVDGDEELVTDPSLLDAGTYTIYSNGLAKNPDNLSNDYGKTIRICPNTKEIVVRPDNSLYWYGVLCNSGEEASTANGWSVGSGYSWVAPTYSERYVTLSSGSSTCSAICTKHLTDASTLKAVVQGVTIINSQYGWLGQSSAKTTQSGTDKANIDTTTEKVYSASVDTGKYYYVWLASGRKSKVSALWYE